MKQLSPKPTVASRFCRHAAANNSENGEFRRRNTLLVFLRKSTYKPFAKSNCRRIDAS